MGDDESRAEDARIEAAIDKALVRGDMGYCWYCKDPTARQDEDGRWLCRYCAKMMDEPGD